MITETDKTFIALKYGSVDLAYAHWHEKVSLGDPDVYPTHELTKFFSNMPDHERQTLYYAYVRRRVRYTMNEAGVL